MRVLFCSATPLIQLHRTGMRDFTAHCFCCLRERGEKGRELHTPMFCVHAAESLNKNQREREGSGSQGVWREGEK